MSVPFNVFKKDNSEYINYMNPVEDYIKQMASFMSLRHNISMEEAIKLTRECIKVKKPRNPKVIFKERNDFGDRSVEDTTLMSYIKDVKKNKDIITPSFTVYEHPDKNPSIISFFIDDNVKERSMYKKLMFKAEREGNKDNEDYYNNQQSSKKVANNGASGGFGSSGTVLYNPSAHSSLTSTTRCISGIGNAISESIVGGNKYFKTEDTVFSYLTAIYTHIDLKKVDKIMIKYNLKYPTTDDVMNNIVMCSRWYWKNKSKLEYIRSVMDGLPPVVRAAFLYVNDLWSIKELNEDFMRNLISKVSTKVNTGHGDVLEDLNDEVPGTNILTHHIFASDIKGLTIDYKKMLEENDPLVNRLASTAKQIKETFKEYSDFFRTFFVTEVLPPNIHYIKSMIRFNIVLSDTDSTCCSYGKWVKWYFGEDRFDDAGIGVSAAVMTITTQVMDHCIKLFSKNLNFGNKKDFRLEMKNEFYWPVFVTSDLSKHYFASTMIREGNVFSKNKLEKKGVHYISSTFGKDISKASEDMMLEIMDKTAKGEKLSLSEYCERVADMEQQLLDDIKLGKLYMYKKDSIKGEKAYKQDKEESKYINHMLWEEVFAPDYGSVGKPPYSVYTINLNINNKTDWADMLNEIRKSNPALVERLEKFCSRYNKKTISTLRIPKIIADAYGVPEIFIPFIDGKGIVIKTLISLYYVLSTLGFYVSDKYLVSEVLNREKNNGNS